MTAPAARRQPDRQIYDLGYRRLRGPAARPRARDPLAVHRTASGRPSASAAAAGRRSPRSSSGRSRSCRRSSIVGALTLAARFGGRRARSTARLADRLRHATLGSIAAIIGLFCAAQAPELFGRDQRHGVLAAVLRPRPPPVRLRRSPGSLGFVARAAGPLCCPMVVLFLGRVLLVDRRRRPRSATTCRRCPPVLAQALVSRGPALRRPVDGRLGVHAAPGVRDAGIIALFIVPGSSPGSSSSSAPATVGDVARRCSARARSSTARTRLFFGQATSARRCSSSTCPTSSTSRPSSSASSPVVAIASAASGRISV